jgi:hypothetical protein
MRINAVKFFCKYIYIYIYIYIYFFLVFFYWGWGGGGGGEVLDLLTDKSVFCTSTLEWHPF